jgi:hypothetical protein
MTNLVLPYDVPYTIKVGPKGAMFVCRTWKNGKSHISFHLFDTQAEALEAANKWVQRQNAKNGRNDAKMGAM